MPNTFSNQIELSKPTDGNASRPGCLFFDRVAIGEGWGISSPIPLAWGHCPQTPPSLRAYGSSLSENRINLYRPIRCRPPSSFNQSVAAPMLAAYSSSGSGTFGFAPYSRGAAKAAKRCFMMLSSFICTCNKARNVIILSFSFRTDQYKIEHHE